MRKHTDRKGRRLTHDELKAAEAAFQERPINEAWSQAARAVYDGILAAKIKLDHESFTHGLAAPNHDPQGTEELVGAATIK